jgi:hypothetical protein
MGIGSRPAFASRRICHREASEPCLARLAQLEQPFARFGQVDHAANDRRKPLQERPATGVAEAGTTSEFTVIRSSNAMPSI